MSINIMKLKKQSLEEQCDSNTRFLVRHSSSSGLSIFSCCSSSSANDYESLHPQKPQPQKISIKNVIKKSGIFGNNGNTSINSSRLIQGDKIEQRFDGSRIALNRRKSQLSESLLNQHSERTIPNKKPQKINFVYNKEESDKSIHNYHTTNYIVEKFIVQPQEMNIFVKPQQEKEEHFEKNEADDYDEMIRYHQDPAEQQNHTWKDSPNHFIESQDRTRQEPSNNCHFSFGHHQKNMFMNKFGGFREVSSNRPSKQSAKIQSTSEAIPSQSKNGLFQFANSINFNKRPNLYNLVRDVHVMDEEFDDSSSGKSQVIDSYQNIMSRIQQKSRIMSLGNHQ